MTRPSGRYYIIEHPTKGVLREVDRSGPVPVPRWSWSMRRNSPQALRFTYLPDAIACADELHVHQGVTGRRRTVLSIRKAPNFRWRCWECGRWIDTTADREWGHHRSCPMVGGGD